MKKGKNVRETELHTDREVRVVNRVENEVGINRVDCGSKVGTPMKLYGWGASTELKFYLN